MLRRKKGTKERRKEGKKAKEDKVGDGIKKDSVQLAGTEAPGSKCIARKETWAMSHALVQ